MATSKGFIKGRNYYFELKYGDEDLTVYLKKIKITNSMNSIYPVVAFNLNVDTINFTDNDLYGQKPFKLTIMLMGEDQQPKQTITMDLLYLQNRLSMTQKEPQSKETNEDRGPVALVTLIQPCYTLMSTYVNFIKEEPASKPPLDLVQEALQSAGITDMTIDQRGKNQEAVGQLIIPPMSVNKTIDYMHEKYGLYDGPFYKFCGYDIESSKPKLILADLNQIISNDNPVYTIYQLPAGSKDKSLVQKIKEKVDGNPDKFAYTNLPLETSHQANARLMEHSFKKIQIIHPADTLFSTIEKDMAGVANQFGIWHSTKTMKTNPELTALQKYCYNLKGHNYSESALTSRMAWQTRAAATIKTTVIRNVQLKNLFSPGVIMQIEPTTQEYMTYQGKYVCFSSDISWEKLGTDQWNCGVDLEMIRCSQEK